MGNCGECGEHRELDADGFCYGCGCEFTDTSPDTYVNPDTGEEVKE